jgi:predicted RNase H-like HicB family nuclease
MTMQSKEKNKLLITVCIEKDEPGYHAYCPKLKGLHVYGDTPEEATANIKSALIAYLNSLVKHNEPIPADLFYKEQNNVDFCHNSESIIEHLELVPA